MVRKKLLRALVHVSRTTFKEPIFRATVTSIAPNFVRAALVPNTFLFEIFVHRYNIITEGYIMIFLLSAIAIFALTQLKESFNRDLNYLEE